MRGDLALAPEQLRGHPRPRRPSPRAPRGWSASRTIAAASARGVAGRHDHAAAVPLRQRGDLAQWFDRGDVRASGGEDRIELARHDVAGQAGLQRHQAHVARCIGPAQLIARLERAGSARCSRPRAADGSFQRRPPVAVADEQEQDVAASIAAARRRRSPRRGSATSPMLPACRTTKRRFKPCARGEGVVLWPTARSPRCRPSCGSR